MDPDKKAAQARGFFGHPPGLRTLFFTEMWERFSFYGMKPLMVLYMPLAVAEGGLGFDDATAGMVLAIYSALVYFSNLPGGVIADRYLGQRRAVLLGGCLIMAGHMCLTVHGVATFYAGLGLIVMGTGLLKPNMTAMVGQLYAPGDARRDAGFSLYYLGINTGAFLAPLVCGFLAQHAWFRTALGSAGIDPRMSWHFGFGAAAVGMGLGLLQYVAGAHRLGTAGLPPAAPRPIPRLRTRLPLRRAVALLASLAALAWGTWQGAGLISVQAINAALGVALVVVPAMFFGLLLVRQGGYSPAEKKRLLAVAALFVFTALFFAAFEQASGTLNLFADRNTRNSIAGYRFPSTWFQFVNPALILALTPVFAWLWVRLGDRQPSSPAKFATALLTIGVSFSLLTWAALVFAWAGERVSPAWLTAVFFLNTVAELCISPVGLSLVTRLAPAGAAGRLMGLWFLASALGNYWAAQALVLTPRFSQAGVFGFFAALMLVAGGLLVLVIQPIRRLTGEHRPPEKPP